jgi:hypothetical protein
MCVRCQCDRARRRLGCPPPESPILPSLPHLRIAAAPVYLAPRATPRLSRPPPHHPGCRRGRREGSTRGGTLPRKSDKRGISVQGWLRQNGGATTEHTPEKRFRCLLRSFAQTFTHDRAHSQLALTRIRSPTQTFTHDRTHSPRSSTTPLSTPSPKAPTSTKPHPKAYITRPRPRHERARDSKHGRR